jgi:hypothetical protein
MISIYGLMWVILFISQSGVCVKFRVVMANVAPVKVLVGGKENAVGLWGAGKKQKTKRIKIIIGLNNLELCILKRVLVIEIILSF